MAKNNEQSPIVEKASQYVKEILRKTPTNYLYHNIKHTEDVVASANFLAKGFHLNKKDHDILVLAAWFHDVEYASNKELHEEKGAKIASDFLIKEDYDQHSIDQVVKCIKATKMHYQPTDFLEKLIRDADCAHLGKKIAQRRSDLLRMEWELVEGKHLSEIEWLKTNVDFLQDHKYYTTIAKSEWGPTKEKNLKKIEKQLNAIIVKEDDISTTKEEKEALKRSRGVETMFRVTLRNHINLSTIADNKANFLLSISAIILSLLLGELITDNKPVIAFVLPTLYFLVVCVITMVLAILATRPNISVGKFSREGLKNKKTNILFFGNFHAMPLEEFTWGINELMKEDELLYDSLTKDLYYLGKVLNKKYQYLRYAFNFFMFGIISSAIFYAIMLIIN